MGGKNRWTQWGFYKELENKKESRLKKTITEMKKKKNTLEGISKRLDDTEENTSDLEDRVIEITQS